MPPLEAVAVDPGPTVVALGQLTVPQRKRLAVELRARGVVPLGAPHAGLGGASSSDGPSTPWVVAGFVCLMLSALSILVSWRRRRSP
jgi:hypothetical protein